MKKNILIFGAYGALGRGVTETLLTKNYDKYYLIGSKAETSGISSENVVNINSADLSDENNVRSVFSRINNVKDSLYFLFSSIGGFWGGKELKDTDKDDWDKMFNMNLKSNFLIAKHFIQIASEGKGGAACFTSAFSGFYPEARRIAYGSSKAALNYLIESLAEECLDKNISVTGIAPYMIDTNANREWGKPEDFDKWQKPQEIGELIHFIFSNYHFLSGNIITLKTRFRT